MTDKTLDHNFQISNDIPIALDNISFEVISTLNYYREEIERYKDLISKLNRNKNDHSTLIRGFESNISVFQKLRSKVENITKKNIFPDNLKKIIAPLYLDSFQYLRRDWCYTEEGEKEINLITHCLKEALSNLSYEDNSDSMTLVLGAGTGRLAVEITNISNSQVIAIDKSLSMACWFDILKNDVIHFSEINLRNVMYANEKVLFHKAYVDNKFKKSYKKIKYYVGDALKLPFQKNSFSLIFSIYFTDVVILDQLIMQIDKVLKNKGLFIHFGPLNYHFKSILNMYSADEVISKFRSYGYSLIYSDIHISPSFDKANSLKRIFYHNLIYVFQKK